MNVRLQIGSVDFIPVFFWFRRLVSIWRRFGFDLVTFGFGLVSGCAGALESCVGGSEPRPEARQQHRLHSRRRSLYPRFFDEHLGLAIEAIDSVSGSVN